MLPTDFIANSDYSQMMPELGGSMYKPHQPPQYVPYKPNTYQKPGYFNPTVRPVYSQPIVSHYRPPKMVNSPSHLDAMIETPLPVPVRNNPSYSNMASSHMATFAYDKCGARPSIGITGRVQNLNYHDSSTEFGEFPWQVAILKKLGPSDNLYVCGGALISSNFILTAAHCIKK